MGVYLLLEKLDDLIERFFAILAVQRGNFSLRFVNVIIYLLNFFVFYQFPVKFGYTHIITCAL